MGMIKELSSSSVNVLIYRWECSLLPCVRPVPHGGEDLVESVRRHLERVDLAVHAAVLNSPVKKFLINAQKSEYTAERHLISSLMQMSASQNLSSSDFGSDSVGSIMRQPVTGHDMVGAWNP